MEDSNPSTVSSDNIVTVAKVLRTDKLTVRQALQETVMQDNRMTKSLDNLSDDKIIDTKPAESDSEFNSSFESVPTQLFSVVDSKHCERMSPLEEFNSLHRHCEGVRKSIKLKESSIV